ncbi:hypothetical protein NQ314_016313 [Rhamnusium bicolor]|uniref:Immunoglobulin I-set domain-containing protein n=1 Tax=Rhamnusium bicolor TaxID=1586634 RepID=A0AAV8WXA0_9CUCU|nr:hypothetical protein NQ314_016313 [Rhamnusium bicolor]
MTLNTVVSLNQRWNGFWTKKEIKPDLEERITIDKYEKNTIITVRRCTRVDSGKYRLVLTNSSGTCEGIAEVIVLDKPTPPKRSFES